jgi:uncharacterized membrane protein YfcA
MLTHVIETATPGLIVLLAISLVIAGLVKGMIGVGMPIVAFPMLSMLVDVQAAVIAALSGPLVFIFLLAKGLSSKAFTKEASMFLVVSSVLLASALTSSQKFDWHDVLISTLVTAPVVAGMLVGQKVRDAVPADAFKTLVVLAVLLSGAQLVWKGVFG